MFDTIPIMEALLGGLFVAACAFFNYRSGLKKGQELGIEFTLNTLELKNVIKIDYLNNSTTIVRGDIEGAKWRLEQVTQ